MDCTHGFPFKGGAWVQFFCSLLGVYRAGGFHCVPGKQGAFRRKMRRGKVY